MGAHERPKARYCCEGHMRRANAQKVSATMKLRRIYARIDAKAKERARTRQHWRAIAMGQDVQLHIDAIFAAKRSVRPSSGASFTVLPYDHASRAATASPRVTDPAQAVTA